MNKELPDCTPVHNKFFDEILKDLSPVQTLTMLVIYKSTNDLFKELIDYLEIIKENKNEHN